MGGDISVQSRLQQGTVFSFDILAQLTDSKHVTSAQKLNSVTHLAPSQPSYRVLIVDDKPINRRLLVVLLSPVGFTLKEAAI